MSVAQVVTHVCENFVGRQQSARGRFACADFIGGFDIISDESRNCSGTIVSESETLSYSFYRRAGADAVLKKLGDAIVDLGVISASCQSGSNTRDSYTGMKIPCTVQVLFPPPVPLAVCTDQVAFVPDIRRLENCTYLIVPLLMYVSNAVIPA